ncbi:cytochrome c oxidase subunit 3 [Haloferula sp. BvORR071]|uniref:cytochrome c oxidase subunit 3 n=1 Tax=Haloferula sp. BvORR071 TaxID=1396141 RepID=UPI000555A3CA|nr:cytochrome c oxidase subunit 3 [Haloferula sp. BvORR071]
MEIPYIFTPRKDTGLVNSKIAIWLFLASEVMLFGGFFSAYIFLRLGADYPWPERTLPVLPGLINTFVLIGSSVTVIFAWMSLKLRKWRQFQIFMAITVVCAGIFMVLKGIEYNVKFHHQAVRLKDYAILEGHLGFELKEGVHVGHGEQPKEEDFALNHHGKKIEEDTINYSTSEVSFNTVRYHHDWVEEIIAHAEAGGTAVTLKEDVVMGKGEQVKVDKDGNTEPATTPLSRADNFAKGSALSMKLLERITELHKDARAHNADLRITAFRKAWTVADENSSGKTDRQLAPDVKIDESQLDLHHEQPAIAFTVAPETVFHFRPRDIQENGSPATLRDGTALTGKLEESPMVFHYVDALDFRYLALKVRQKLGVDEHSDAADGAIEKAIEESWVMAKNPELKEIWEKQQKAVGLLAAELAAHKRVPTEKDKYRINWQEMAYYATTPLADIKIDAGKYVMPHVDTQPKEQFFGPNYEGRAEQHAFPHLEIPREQVAFASKFAPAWNTYYAIYFTMTGLHGLHVIGGALVLAYYLFFGKKMYLSNPEWLANRVEVGGLFWHFVDLVWIFLFPILYLM